MANYTIQFKNPKHTEQLQSYLDLCDTFQVDELTLLWDNFRKNALLSVKDGRVVLPCTIKGKKNFTRLGFDNNFLVNFDFSDFDDHPLTHLESLMVVRILKKWLKWKKPFYGQSTFQSIWDNIGGDIYKWDVIQKNEKTITWEKLKVYNFFNEIYPLLKEEIGTDRQIAYLEIGAGSCGLIKVMKRKMDDLQAIIVDLPTTIPSGFCNLSHSFPDCTFLLPNEIQTAQQTDLSKFDFVFLTPDLKDILSDNYFDIAVNTDSFAEMSPDVVRGYFNLMRIKNLF